MELAVVTPRSRCSHGVNSKVFGRGIQESEIAELHISPPHTDPPWYRKGRIIMSVVVQEKAQ
jgi:hypothetical protein